MNKSRIGIASFAHMHAYSYLSVMKSLENVKIAGFCDLNDSRAKRIEQEAGLKRYHSYEELTGDKEIDAILITSETIHHAGIAIAAFENGKDVIVEKPIATTITDANRMIDSAKKNGRRLFQCYPCRYHPSAIQVKKSIEDGDFGEILGITATNHGCMPDHDNPEFRWFSDKKLAGGGAVMDHTTHAADLIFWFTGWEPSLIHGIAKKLFHDDIDSDDAGMVLIKFKNGMVASIDPSWSRPVSFPTWGDLTMIIYGSKMTATMDMFNQNIHVHANTARKSTTWQSFSSDIDFNMFSAYIDTLNSGEDPPVTGEDGLKALKVATKAYESNEIGSFVEW